MMLASMTLTSSLDDFMFCDDDSPVGLQPVDRRMVEEVFLAHEIWLFKIADKALPANVKVKYGASDVVQDVFLVAWLNLHNFKGSGPEGLKAWMEGITRNICKQTYRNVTNRGEVSLQAMGHFLDGGQRDRQLDLQDYSCIDPLELASHQELKKVLGRCVSKLPVKLATVMHIKIEEDLTVTEIAERLTFETSAIQKRYERAMKRLVKMPELFKMNAVY